MQFHVKKNLYWKNWNQTSYILNCMQHCSRVLFWISIRIPVIFNGWNRIFLNSRNYLHFTSQRSKKITGQSANRTNYLISQNLFEFSADRKAAPWTPNPNNYIENILYWILIGNIASFFFSLTDKDIISFNLTNTCIDMSKFHYI